MIQAQTSLSRHAHGGGQWRRTFTLFLARFIRAFGHGLKDAEFHVLLYVLAGLLLNDQGDCRRDLERE